MGNLLRGRRNRTKLPSLESRLLSIVNYSAASDLFKYDEEQRKEAATPSKSSSSSSVGGIDSGDSLDGVTFLH